MTKYLPVKSKDLVGRAMCSSAISTSGNSPNVVRAVDVAKQHGIYTVGFLGRDGGNLGFLVDLALVVPSDETARIQEAHIFLGHVMCALIEQRLGIGGWDNSTAI